MIPAWFARWDASQEVRYARDVEFTNRIGRLVCRIGRADLAPKQLLRAGEGGLEITAILAVVLDRIDETNRHIDDSEYEARIARDSNEQ
jgi:hypothetical protein